MGGKKAWGRQSGNDSYAAASWPSSAYWGYWKGTWSPRNTKSAERYDQVELRHQPATSLERDDDGYGRSAYLTAVQRAVTAARKQDVRLRKINEEKLSRQKLWKQYVEDTKRKFAKQKREFEQDMQRLEADRVATIEAGQMSAAQVKAIVIGQSRPPQTAEPLETEAAWEALWRGVEAPPSGATFLDEAMAAAAQGGMEVDLPTWEEFGPPAAEAPELKPVHLPPAPPGLPEPTYTALSPNAANARYAPYPATSPVTRPVAVNTGVTLTAEEPTRHYGPRDPGPHHAPAGERPPRQGVKEATKRPPARPPTAGLAEKLEAKRKDAEGVAMRPFRTSQRPGPSDAGTASGENGVTTEPPGHPGGRIPILEDDEESEEDPTHE